MRLLFVTASYGHEGLFTASVFIKKPLSLNQEQRLFIGLNKSFV